MNEQSRYIVEELIYSKQEAIRIGEGLNKILLKHQNRILVNDAHLKLTEKRSELLEVLMKLAQHYYLNYQQSNYNHYTNKPLVQLQQLYDALLKYETREQSTISFKFPGKVVKVDEPVTAGWIRELLLKALNDFEIPGQFGANMFLISSPNNPLQSEENTALLKSYAKRPVSFSKVIYGFCNGLMNYLEQTFQLAPHEAQLFSESQLSFLYEVLCLLQFEGFEDAFNDNELPNGLDIDRLYQLLNKEHRANA